MLKWQEPETYKYNPKENVVIKWYSRYDDCVLIDFTEAGEVNGDQTNWIKSVIENDDGSWATDSVLGWAVINPENMIPIEKETEKSADATRLYIYKTYEVDWNGNSFDFTEWYNKHGSNEELPEEAYTLEVGLDVRTWKGDLEFNYTNIVKVVGYIDIQD